ncbi:MAG: hypothetical protein EPN92_07565 [Chitinophagaceae bacterium]|nr:MAG: hypothetical protein EPN92_07565 [Chitinophagaceae bacterium]
MKKMILSLMAISCFVTILNAQEAAVKEPPQKYMQITTIESVIGGGFGRSKMVITKEDGTQEDRDMENLFSLTGLNLKNIKANESDILKTLKSFTDEGWKLYQVIPLTLSPGDKGSGIFMTRYLLSKPDEKKGF